MKAILLILLIVPSVCYGSDTSIKGYTGFDITTGYSKITEYDRSNIEVEERYERTISAFYIYSFTDTKGIFAGYSTLLNSILSGLAVDIFGKYGLVEVRPAAKVGVSYSLEISRPFVFFSFDFKFRNNATISYKTLIDVCMYGNEYEAHSLEIGYSF